MKSSLIWHKTLKIQMLPEDPLLLLEGISIRSRTETAEQYTSHHSRSSSHMSSSKRSSQRQRDLELSRLKREELGKKHEAKLRILKQRLDIEKQMKLRELEIVHLDEDHRKQVAAAAL